MKKKILIVNNQGLSAALWELFIEHHKKQSELAALLKISTSSVQALLSGRTRIEVNRLHLVCDFMAIPEQKVYDLRDTMVNQARKELGSCVLLSEFPSSLKQNEVILRTLQINARRTDGVPWAEVIHQDGFSSDDFLRARGAMGWSREKAATAFGMHSGTIEHWEKISFPRHHEDAARRVFRSILTKAA